MTQTPHIPHATLFTLGDVFASIPGLLGYYPQESTILLALERDADTGAILLGPVLRADLPQTAEAAVFALEHCTADTFGFLGLVVSRIPTSELVAEAIDELSAARDLDGLPLLDACWHLSEIATGTPYTMLFGPTPAELHSAGLPRDWVSGIVPSVMAQPTMGPLLAQGALPELSREHTRAFFDHDPAVAPRITTRELADVYRRGYRLVDKLDSEPIMVKAAVERARETLRTASARPLVGEGAKQAHLPAPREDLEHVAVILSRSPLRDCLFSVVLEAPLPAAAVLATIARSYEGVIRANALSLWAVAAVRMRLSSWACAALACAQEEIEEHSLSAILAQLLMCGEHDTLLATAAESSNTLWKEGFGA